MHYVYTYIHNKIRKILVRITACSFCSRSHGHSQAFITTFLHYPCHIPLALGSNLCLSWLLFGGVTQAFLPAEPGLSSSCLNWLLVVFPMTLITEHGQCFNRLYWSTFCCGDKTPKKTNLKEERFIWLTVSEISVHGTIALGLRQWWRLPPSW
jgi:hypothetical protein